MRKSKRIALFMLSLVFAVSAGIFALGTAFAAPAYKDTAVTRHPFGEAAGMYMDLTTYGDMKTDGTYPIGGTFPTDIGATVNYNADAKALHILFTAPKSVGDKVQIPQGSTLTDPDGNGVKFSESVTLTLTADGWILGESLNPEYTETAVTGFGPSGATLFYMTLSDFGGMLASWNTGHALKGSALAAFGTTDVKYVPDGAENGTIYVGGLNAQAGDTIVIPAGSTLFSVNNKGVRFTEAWTLTFDGTAWTAAKGGSGEPVDPEPEKPNSVTSTRTPSFTYGYGSGYDLALTDIEDFIGASGGYTLIGDAKEDADKNLVLENGNGKTDYNPSILIKGKENGYFSEDYAVRFRSVYTYPEEITWTEGSDLYPGEDGEMTYMNPDDIAYYFAAEVRGTTQNSVYLSNNNAYLISFQYNTHVDEYFIQFHYNGMTGSGDLVQTVRYEKSDLDLKNGEEIYIDFGCYTDQTESGKDRFTYFVKVWNHDFTKSVYAESSCVGEEVFYLSSGWVRIYNYNRIFAQTVNVMGVEDGVGALSLYKPQFTLTDENKIEKQDISEIAPVGDGITYKGGSSVLDIANFTKNREIDMYLTFGGKIDATLSLLANGTDMKSGYQIVFEADGLYLKTVDKDGNVVQQTEKALYADKLDVVPEPGKKFHLKVRAVEFFEGVVAKGIYLGVYSNSSLISEGYLEQGTSVQTGSLFTGKTGADCTLKVESCENKNVRPAINLITNKTEIAVGKIARLDYENTMPVYNETVKYEIVGGTGEGTLALNEELGRWELTGTKAGTVELRVNVSNAFGTFSSEKVTVTVSGEGGGNGGGSSCSSCNSSVGGIGLLGMIAALTGGAIVLAGRKSKKN